MRLAAMEGKGKHSVAASFKQCYVPTDVKMLSLTVNLELSGFSSSPTLVNPNILFQ